VIEDSENERKEEKVKSNGIREKSKHFNETNLALQQNNQTGDKGDSDDQIDRDFNIVKIITNEIKDNPEKADTPEKLKTAEQSEKYNADDESEEVGNHENSNIIIKQSNNLVNCHKKVEQCRECFDNML